MVHNLLQCPLIVAALCLTTIGQSLRADDVPAERRLPPGVLAFLTIPDAVDLKNRFMDSNTGRMLQDDSLEEFRGQFEEMWDEASRGMQEDIGLSASEVIDLVDGEFTVAVLQPPGRSLGVALLLEFGDHRDTLDTILENVREDAEKEGVTRTVETIEDTEVTVYTRDNEDGGPDTVAMAVVDAHLVVSFGNDVDLMEDLLIRWDGEHSQTFAGDEVFSHIMQKSQSEDGASPQLKWYFSPIDLFRSIAMLPQANQGGISPAMALGFLPALGLDKFKAVGGTTFVGTEEYDGMSRMFIYVDQPTSGLVKFFEFPAVRQEPPRWVPANVSAYSSANWDVSGAYEAVEAIVDFFQPPGTLRNVIDQLSKQGPQVHVKDDVIDSLTGRFQMLGTTRDESGGAGGQPVEVAGAQPGVFALELRDSEKMSDVLARVAEFSQGNLETREFRGVTIYETEIPNFQGGPQQAMGLAVAKDQLFFATDVQLLEDYLRIDEADEPLANSTDYRRVSSHFPSQTSIISFARPAAQWKPMYEQLRSGQFDALVDQIDFSTLPEFDELAEYFSTSGGYAVPAEKGALMVNFSLRKD